MPVNFMCARFGLHKKRPNDAKREQQHYHAQADQIRDLEEMVKPHFEPHED